MTFFKMVSALVAAFLIATAIWWTLMLCLITLFAIEAPVSMDITPRRGIGGTDVRVVVQIAPNPANRRLTLVVDGPNYWSGSDTEIDAKTRIVDRAFKHIPEGRYAIIAAVIRAGSKVQRAVETVCYTGPTEDCGDGQ